ncbi:hypothetical protein BH23VER1_BH23VER1_26030 [soil metagenome]
MKTSLPILVAALLAAAPQLPAQKNSPVPQAGRRIVGSGDAGGGAGATVTPRQTVTSLSAVAKLGPSRQWTNAEEKTIVAELVSWPIADPEAATKGVDELKIDVIRDGKVRLRMGEKTHTLALESLSTADQNYIKGIAQQIAKGGAEEAAPKEAAPENPEPEAGSP